MDFHYFQENDDDDDWSDTEDSKPSVPPPVRVLPPSVSDKQLSESSPSQSSNSLFAEEPEDTVPEKPETKPVRFV